MDGNTIKKMGTNNETWEKHALYFKEVMEIKGIKASHLANKINVSPSTITRFFNLDFCLRFDYILRIIEALDLPDDYTKSIK